MQCSKETFGRLFYNASSSFFLLFFFFYFTSIFLTKAFNFLGGNLLFPRNQNEYEYGVFSDEEEEEENRVYDEDSMQKHDEYHNHGDLEANILDGGQTLHFVPNKISQDHETDLNPDENEGLDEESGDSGVEENHEDSENLSVYGSPALESVHREFEEEEEDQEEVRQDLIPRIRRRDADSSSNHHRRHIQTNENDPTSKRATNHHQQTRLIKDNNIHEAKLSEARLVKDEKKIEDGNSNKDEKFLVFAPSKMESKKLAQPHQGKENNNNNNNNNILNEEDIFGDTCTVGSTSKSSSEWRSSNINYRDSGTDDPFSSSSRRSCPKWESYSVFQKYDEEMLFLDRISAQKLHETESLKSIQACPRSISERIIHKLGTKHKSSVDFRHNPYHELEATYVAQLCYSWEVLNWNYKYFQRLRASRRENDPGCPAYVAQQFQQFLVLLQRYVENEPYEHGRRPEIYARMRRLAPKLLQVPEYRDSEEEKKDESFGSRISSDSFMLIMEESIRTFMNFLKADRESRCRILAAFLKRKHRGSADAALLLLLKKVNKKKKMKIKELKHSGNCLRQRRLKLDEEMEILMALVDLKVVSRVLRMRELTEEQLHWCEDKMSKVRVSDRKLQRDSSPLFFPAH
ncbi:OLC1v1014196C1 [Oldenlandia corymbosa var. corymbosa]|uniref:OLC1v1014196C1 n=1 Tax=Oldenlandia corymbosa var. corymbosa TaxID=529605 RepID=A0AAV1E044_OLDCO|nr:OLC1v1014196C1 [Oldenlandia corymbosa var. corymbosa]